MFGVGPQVPAPSEISFLKPVEARMRIHGVAMEHSGAPCTVHEALERRSAFASQATGRGEPNVLAKSAQELKGTKPRRELISHFAILSSRWRALFAKGRTG